MDTSLIEQIFDTQTEYPKKLKTALQRQMAGEITFEQLEDACVDWAYANCLADYSEKPLPTMPYEAKIYNDLPERDRQKISKASQKRVEVQEMWWLDECRKIKAINNANRDWLKIMTVSFERRGLNVSLLSPLADGGGV